MIGILAAGASARMRGRDKLLESVAGEALLARQIRIAGALGVPVCVALPAGAPTRRRLVDAAQARSVPVADAGTGMSASIRALAREAEAAGAPALLLLLADMPEIEAEDLRRLLAEAEHYPNVIIRATTEDGRPGHPVVFPRQYFKDLQVLEGDTGARSLLASGADVRLVPLPGERAVTDLDTPEAWDDWRRRKGVTPSSIDAEGLGS